MPPIGSRPRRQDYPNRHYLSPVPCAQVPSIYLMIGSAHALVLFTSDVRSTKRSSEGEAARWTFDEALLCRSLALKASTNATLCYITTRLGFYCGNWWKHFEAQYCAKMLHWFKYSFSFIWIMFIVVISLCYYQKLLKKCRYLYF